jgi:glucose-6-phosphate 1-dehydrogenase
MPLTLSDAEQRLNDEGLTIVILGASGDLARKKTFPALFDLAHTRMLPSHIKIVGYARSAMDSKGLQELVRAGLKTPHAEELDSFLARLSYVRGSYDSDADGMKLNEHIAALEAAGAREVNNRMFYFALPPSVFVDMGRTVKATSMARTGWTRCVIEKPFGSDLESSNALSQKLSALFVEDQIYRIDHYLGKEMVELYSLFFFFSTHSCTTTTTTTTNLLNMNIHFRS